MRKFLLLGLLLITFGHAFAQTAIVEADYGLMCGGRHGGGRHGGETPGTAPAEKPQGCDLWFTQHNICGRITFVQNPAVNQDSPFQIIFSDASLNPVDPAPVFVDLWMNMGGHGHGSAPVKTTRLQEGVYRIDNVYFVMGGTWEIRTTIGHGTPQAEVDKTEITVR